MVAGQGTLAAVKARPRGTLLKASVVLLAVAAVSKLMTLAADAFVAGRFGLSVDTDAYLLGIGLIGAALGAPSETLRLSVIPLCGQHLREGRRREAAGAAALVLLIAVLLGTAIALTILAAGPWLAAIAAPGFGSDGHRTLLRLLWLLTLMPVVGLAMAVLLGVLHAQLRFGVPALVGIGIAASIVGMGLLLGGSLGVAALVLGHVVGTTIVTLLLALMAWDMFADGAVLRQAWRELKPFVRLALPTGLAITMVSLGAVIERALASSTGAGNVAALGFAIKLVTQVAVVSQSIWTPLTPLMTASGASVDDRGDNRLAVFSLKLVLLVMMPATALLIALREPLVAVIFERGAFTAADTAKTATLLALHSGSLVGEGLFMVSVAVLLSLHDVWTRVIASVLLIAAKVALSLALLPFLGVAGIALAASASSLLAGAFSLQALARLWSPADVGGLAAFFARIAGASALVLLVAALASHVVATSTGGETMASRLLQLGTACAATTAVYLTALKVMGLEEVDALVRQLRERLAPMGT